MDRFNEYLYGGHFEVYTNNNPLTYVLTTAKLDAMGQWWIASLANYNFKIFYRSGKLNVEADALSCLLWGSMQMEEVEPLVAKTMLQSKVEPRTNVSEKNPLERVLLRSMVMDTMPILSPKDWTKEQMEDADICKIIQLLESNQLSTYKAQEIDSSAVRVLLKYRKDLVLKNGLLYRKANLKNHQESVVQFVLPNKFVQKVILACHNDNGHLGVEQTLGLLQERFFWPKMAKQNVQNHICTCENCLQFKQPPERAEMQPIQVSHPMELIHLDFLTLGGRTGDTRGTNIMVITDHFTRYAQAYVTPKQTAAVAARALWENFLVHYRWPDSYRSRKIF